MPIFFSMSLSDLLKDLRQTEGSFDPVLGQARFFRLLSYVFVLLRVRHTMTIEIGLSDLVLDDFTLGRILDPVNLQTSLFCPIDLA